MSANERWAGRVAQTGARSGRWPLPSRQGTCRSRRNGGGPRRLLGIDQRPVTRPTRTRDAVAEHARPSHEKLQQRHARSGDDRTDWTGRGYTAQGGGRCRSPVQAPPTTVRSRPVGNARPAALSKRSHTPDAAPQAPNVGLQGLPNIVLPYPSRSDRAPFWQTLQWACWVGRSRSAHPFISAGTVSGRTGRPALRPAGNKARASNTKSGPEPGSVA